VLVTSSANAATINITANGNVVKAANKDTGSTGTGSTSTSHRRRRCYGTLDVTNKNASVTLTRWHQHL
jgi:hypothetical protein